MHRRTLALLSVAALLVVSDRDQASARSAAQPYTCGNLSSEHCYAIAPVGNHVRGFRTKIHVADRLNPGDGFITNEFWLTNYTGVYGWIEVGYMVHPVFGIEYFWAERGDDGVYHHHDIRSVPRQEIGGTAVTFTIVQIGEDRFRVSIKGPITDFTAVTAIHLWSGQEGGYVNVGQELAGTIGAQASLATFSENSYVRGSGWQPVVEAGSWLSVNRPPFAEWLVAPSEPRLNGGVLATWCCSANPQG